MSGDPEPKKVPEPSYQGLKAKITNAAKFIDSQCGKYKEEKRVVTNYDEKDALNRHLKNAQEALEKYERYSELQYLWTDPLLFCVVDLHKIAKLSMKTAKIDKTITL